MDALELIILFCIILNGLLRLLPHVFYEPYRSHSACYVWYEVLRVPKDDAAVCSGSVNNMHLG